MGDIKASPRNRLLGLLADATQGGIDFASRPFGYDNPPVRGLLAMTPAQSIANTLNELSYGGALGTGSGMTWKPKADAVDAAMTLLPLGATAGKAAIDGGVALAKKAAPAIERAVPRIMERGGLPAQLMTDMTQGTVSPATVWHGSPHKFDKFDSSKIGTGEGAQAYGHGLYLAESPETASFYRDKLITSGTILSRGDALEARSNVLRKVADRVEKSDPERAAKLRAEADTFTRDGALYKVDLPDDAIAKMLDWDKPLSQQPQNVKDFFAANGFDLGNAMSPAELHSAAKKYLGSRQVSKMANEDIYFARDLSAARKAWNGGADSLEAYMGTGDGSWLRGVLTGAKDGNKSGGAAYRMLADRLGGFGQAAYQGGGQAAASDALRTGGASLLGKSDGLRGFPSGGAGAIISDGIPGIKYFDGGSRGTGAGTSNFVVFPGNEGLLTILERNGQPMGLLGR